MSHQRAPHNHWDRKQTDTATTCLQRKLLLNQREIMGMTRFEKTLKNACFLFALVID